ncbi:MAG: HDIG domain-containing protein [Candidatus Zixiibacteriota bacterium]|nr:MAG: HDIG domain-containing protein [candidate division Zixibacteria bacterium]
MNKIFPLIDRISNSSLLARTVSCWEEAVKRGGWTKDELYKIPFTLLPADYKPGIVTHTNGVAEAAVAMAEVFKRIYGDRIEIDLDSLISGAILHDVGKVLEYTERNGKFHKSDSGKLVRHPVSGAALAAEMGLPAEVQHIIATHSYEGDKIQRTVESVLVHHADFANFEALGGKA